MRGRGKRISKIELLIKIVQLCNPHYGLIAHCCWARLCLAYVLHQFLLYPNGALGIKIKKLYFLCDWGLFGSFLIKGEGRW